MTFRHDDDAPAHVCLDCGDASCYDEAMRIMTARRVLRVTQQGNFMQLSREDQKRYDACCARQRANNRSWL